MLVKQFALLVVGYALMFCSSATTLSSHNSPSSHSIHTSSHTSKVHAKTTRSSLVPIAAASHTHHHSTGTGSSLYPLPSANSTLLSTGSLPLITSTSAPAVCPTFTSTLAAKRCPQIHCGPQPMAQVGGGGVLPEKRCVMESTTTVACGCPTPMATTMVLGGCDAGCPPKGCQIAWVTQTPVC